MKTQVSFKATGFNTTEDRDYFINPGNFGDDLAARLMTELESRGFQIESDEGKPGQEDFGWYFSFGREKPDATFMIGHVDESDGEWLGWVEKNAGFISSLFGGRKRGVPEDAVEAIDGLLREMPGVTDIVWESEG